MSIALTCKQDLEATQSGTCVSTHGVMMFAQDLGLLGSSISDLQSRNVRIGEGVNKWR
jgi:hypothetical protein